MMTSSRTSALATLLVCTHSGSACTRGDPSETENGTVATVATDGPNTTVPAQTTAGGTTTGADSATEPTSGSGGATSSGDNFTGGSTDGGATDSVVTGSVATTSGATGSSSGDSSGDTGDTNASESGGNAACDGGASAIGWATANGGTVGGAGGPTTMVGDAAALLALAGADGAQIIIVSGDITLPERLDISSNKTIEGVPGGATLRGTVAIHGNEGEPVENVIVRNLFIDGSKGPTADVFSLQWAHNVWIDHCDIADGADGNLDMTHATDFATVSWTKFRYTAQAPDPDHRFSNLIGHSDGNAAEDEDTLRVTLHHNWWTEGVVERMPRVRFGEVHVFNNLYDSPDASYGVRAGVGAEILVEANYFDSIQNPHEILDMGAEIVAIDNAYVGTSGAQDQAGDAFTPPYAYTPDAADDVAAQVPLCAGPL